MFYLQELFDDLAYGEFANMAIGNSVAGAIPPNKYPKVVSLINLGLLDLYSRFILKRKECVIHQREYKTLYYIRPPYIGDPFGIDPEIYIDGTVEDPPANDIIKFIEAYDEAGNELHINDARYPLDIFIPEPDVIKMVPADPLKVVSLVYQASYPRVIIDGTFDPMVYPLYFPGFLKTALLSHVASRLFVGKESKAAEGVTNLSNTFLYRYESECAKIEKLSLVPMVDDEAEQFTNNGWI